MFENNLIAGVSGQGGRYSIEDSLRFNDNDSAYLSRTPSVAGNRKTWTWSGWVKRGNLGLDIFLFDASIGGSQATLIRFVNNDKLRLYTYDGSSFQYFDTTALFRDVSGWYHIVYIHDTTQSGADKLKLYVNGIRQVGSTTGSVADNSDGYVNSTTQHNLGRFIYEANQHFDGYLAEINFIDGQALTADNFGEINEDTGEWSPKRYAGTYGTNGFYLPFDGNANDSSGNGNNWTENSLSSTDYMLDTPSTNFSVLNSIATITSVSEGNLKTTTTGTTLTWQSAVSTIGVSSGKWYFETCAPQALTNPPYVFIGITTNPNHGAISPNYLGFTADSWGLLNNGSKYNSGSGVSYASSYTGGDVIGCALDMDAGTVEFFKNNVSQGVAYTGLTGTMFCGASVYAGSGTASNNINFGTDSSFAGIKTRQGNTDANGKGDFYYAPPAGGYLALCTDNLPEPAIVQPETQFNVVTYTGNGGTQSITGVGFQPDFVWAKLRTTSSYHRLHDVVRGSDNTLASNVSDAESIGNGIVSFDSDGFTMDSNTNINQSYPYVAWCWKAGGTAVTNTDGAITSSVSANVEAGFSIATYNGNGSTGTIGHGLSKKPDLVIIKGRTSPSNWFVGKPSFGTGNYLALQSTSAMLYYLDGAGGSFFNYGGWSDSVVAVYNGNSESINGIGYSYVMYSFHSVESFSQIGIYVGNGSANGPFVYTNFKPALVLYKRAVGGTGNWILADNEREGYNGDNPALYPNLTLEESIGTSIDLLANGFKILNSASDHNASGSSYIYMAFAENPFNYATGR